MSDVSRSVASRCGWLLLDEGRVCDEQAIGIYVGLGGRQPVCERHSAWLRRRWGIHIRPLAQNAEPASRRPLRGAK